MSNVRQDVMARAAGHAHRASWESDAQAGRALQVTRQTTNGWSHGDRANPLFKYITESDNPYAVEAMTRRVVKQKAVDDLNLPQAITRYREILDLEKAVELEDTRCDMRRGIKWRERARTSEADAVVNLEKAALELRFAAELLSEREVLG